MNDKERKEKREKFNKLTMREMMDYIAEKHPEDKEWFASVAFESKKKKKAVNKKDADGNLIYKQAKDKNGKKKFNEDGTPMMIVAKEYVEVEGSKEEMRMNLLKAKNAFCDKYMPDLKPEKEKKDKPISEELKGWLK